MTERARAPVRRLALPSAILADPMPAVRALLGAALILAAWEGAARGFELPRYILPPPTDVATYILRNYARLVSSGTYTLIESLVGFGIGALIGIACAVTVTMAPATRGIVLPTVMAINSVPVIAWSPLVLLWFGIGMASKIVMVAVAVSFTVFLSTVAGLDRVDPRQVALMRSFGASTFGVFWRLRVPTALPLTMAGLRISTVRAIIVAVVTEMLGAHGGLGWTIYQSTLTMDFISVWAAIFAASVISLAFFGIVSAIERKVVFWT
ncbi:ABC transporter permease [Acuticoccus sediminis]|uniref:ABC transporter permease n=1 Tax=Acuticoccus sediminis TaxID=2184697 RepID=UPI001CFF23EA|nr:ABC transporter permease [Acuticoccus sediminis]